MRHFHKKTIIQGGFFGLGSKPKPKPAVLNPPKVGGFKTISSYSVAEIIDLISDGPIDGLVDQNGKLLQTDIFKGIYLDNTPIQNTESLEKKQALGSISISAEISAICNIWLENGKFREHSKTKWSDSCIFLVKQETYPTIRGSTSSKTFTTPIPNFATNILRSLSEANLPKVWILLPNDNNLEHKIEIHRNPSEIFTTSNFKIWTNFKNSVSKLSASGNLEVSKLAQQNLKALNSFENITKAKLAIPTAAKSIWTGSDASAYFVIKFSGSFSDTAIPISKKIFFDLGDFSFQSGVFVNIFAQPEINDNQQYTGKVDGVIILTFPLRGARKTVDSYSWYDTLHMSESAILNLSNSTSIFVRDNEETLSSKGNSLFNFSNVSCEFKNGDEFQKSLNGFDKIVNDYFYDSKLFGPFITTKPIQRIEILKGDINYKDGINNLKLTVSNSALLSDSEGSLDERSVTGGTNNYSNWNDQNEIRDYDSLSVTHTIENPLVQKVALSISISALSDTMHIDTSGVSGIDGGVLAAGSKIPTVVSIRVETGKIKDGQKLNKKIFTYLIAGMSEGGCLIDFGGDYQDPNKSIEQSVKNIQVVDEQISQKDYINTPFELPPLEDDEDPTTTKRYVKILKLSAETNSVLIQKDLSLAKVTEIIDEKLSYPFSAVAGIKLDATSFSSIPERSYDCRLKLIKIPTNYFPIDGATQLDKRYVKKADNYISQPIYVGDWDGEFTDGWTDNPAWILYDILTSKRYGLGSYIDSSQINKWELYKIARFCDAVDDDGRFLGVSDGMGGLEPRYSCNIIFKEQTKVYDAINVIANLFRGVVFFGGSEIHFLDDRPRSPIALFSNTNVRDGVFNYSNTRRDQASISQSCQQEPPRQGRRHSQVPRDPSSIRSD
jgi:hypothetical protein